MSEKILDIKKWDYEVKTVRLKTEDSERILKRRLATVDAETEKIIGLVPSSYNLIQNRDLVSAMDKIKDKLGLELENIFVAPDKTATIFRYSFGERKRLTLKDFFEKEDPIDFRVDILNSFDMRKGSSKVKISALRLGCSNGMSFPSNVSTFYLSNVSSDYIGDTLERRLPAVCETASIWQNWAKQIPNRVKVGEFISSNFSESVAKKLLSRYEEGKDPSLWGLYNLVTFYISHELKTEDPDNLIFKQYSAERIQNQFYTINFN